MGSNSDTNSSENHIPYGRDGFGFYSDHNTSCYHVNNAAIPLVVDAVQSTHIQPGSVFTIVDYGTADGGTSMPLMYACVKAIREKYGDELPINIIYEDQPVNDFKSLFMRLQGLIPGPPSYLADFSNVFVMACGTNFYEQCFPDSNVSLGFSASSIHWLSQKPCNLTDSISIRFNSNPDENEKFREQAARDWELFLVNRATELAPGGTMVLAQLAEDEHGQFPSWTNHTKECYIKLLSDLWKEMSNEGLITMDEFTSTNLNSHYRTIEEFKKPFKFPDSPVNQAGLELVSIETRVVPCPFRERWINKEKGDATEHAKQLVMSSKQWSYSSFISGLSDYRSKEEKSQIVHEFYRRCEAEVTGLPEDYGLDCIIAYIVIQKRIGLRAQELNKGGEQMNIKQ